MNYFFAIIVPLLFIASFLYALWRKVAVYDAFTQGAKNAISLVTSVFPYLAAVTILTMLLEVSGLQTMFQTACKPLLAAVGIPTEIAPLVIIKPLSGSGSIAVLSSLLETYGADSYVARCACVVYGASETVFYIGAVYFAGRHRKSLTLAAAVSLCSYALSVALACALCRIL